MNVHVSSDYDSRTEMEMLVSTRKNIMGCQASKPNLCIVQDALLGAYLMTKDDSKIPQETFFNICMRGDGWTPKFILDKIQHIRRVQKELGKPILALNGKGLISMMLPEDFLYERKNEAHPTQPIVKIYKGVLIEGALNKANLGPSHNSLLQVLWKEYGEDICMDFINNIQFITVEWILYNGFSIGISDCIATKGEEIRQIVFNNFKEAKRIQTSIQHPKIKEARVKNALDNGKAVGMKIAKEAMDPENGFIATVTSGSKGDYFNISQITGLLGQQNLTGQRIQPVLNKGKRTLPHYAFEEFDVEREFESRGFIKSSFMQGLTPQEYWFHSMSGREGVSDTAMKTANSGYVQRKMIKILEDVQIRYDGTVRNTSGSIFQWAYGDDDYDRSSTIHKGGKAEMMDVERLANKLNLNFEAK